MVERNMHEDFILVKVIKNNMTKNKYKALTDKIVEANPPVEDTLRRKKYFISADGYISIEQFKFGNIYRDITLEDVMIALGNKRILPCSEFEYSPSNDEKLIDIWEMGKPLHLQSENTLSFLYEVIVKK